MRRPLAWLAGLSLLAACGEGPAGTSGTEESLDLVPDYVQSLATPIDGAGIGGAALPDSLRITAEQKAAIAALHEAFKAATAADVAALRAIGEEARAAVRAGKSRDEVHAILAKGAPILARLQAAFQTLQAAIWRVYTPAQRAWIEAHRPKPCGPDGPPRLTDEQKQQIRALQEQFMNQVKDDLAEIRRVVEAAHQALQSGASRERVQEILHQADAARERVRAAERALQQAIDAVLTPEQRAGKCLPARP